MHLSSRLCSGWVLFALVLSFSRAQDFQSYQEQTTRADDVQDLMTQVDDSSGVEYLAKFGYITSGGGDLTNPSEEDIAKAYRMLQWEAGIPVTGTLTPDTRYTMGLPRCSFRMTVKTRSSRRKRFVTFGTRWGGQQITFRVSRYTPDLSRSEVDRIVNEAFKIWSDVIPLSFTPRTSGNVDMDIQFSPRSHGDGENFDGRGGTLAHAYAPSRGPPRPGALSGDTHFDEDETWTDRQRQGVNLLQVAVHEFGHALGLAHSNIQAAVMAAFYRGYNPNFRLHSDDIAGIQSLYGRPVVNPSPTQRPTPQPTQRPTPQPTQRPTPQPTQGPTQRPGDCRGQFDAVASAKLGSNREFTFAFKDSNVYIIHSTDRGPPRVQNVQQTFGTNIYRVDAAIALVRDYSSANLYLFQGSNIFHYTVSVNYDGRNVQIARGSTLRTSEALQGLPDNIDAITSFRGNIYVFKDSGYYRIDGNRVASNYPRPLSVWGLPSSISRIDSVAKWVNGRTYFYVGDQYYRFHATQLRVDSGYPRPIGKWWLQCEPANLEASTDLPWEEELEGGEESGYTDVKTAIQEEQEGTVGAAGAAGVSQLLILLSAMVSVILLGNRV